MNRFLNNNIPTMDVEEISLDEISNSEIKFNMQALNKASSQLINESRFVARFAEQEFTGFKENLKNLKIEEISFEKNLKKPNL